jgi:hypothetical protein
MLGIVKKESKNIPDKRKGFLDKSIKNKDGAIALGSLPNPPLWSWLVATLLGMGIKHGQSGSVLRLVAFGSLFTWAWLELFQGINYFRRLLGLIVLVLLLLGTAHSRKLFV